MKKGIVITFCFLCVLGRAEVPCPEPMPVYDVNDIPFDYDPNKANFAIVGATEIYTGEVAKCGFNHCGPSHQYEKGIAITSPEMPEGMSIVQDPNWMFLYNPKPEDVGVHYIDFYVGFKAAEPNQYSVTDRKTFLIKVKKGIQFLPMCGG